MNPIIEWTVYILFTPIFIAAGIVIVGGTWEILMATLFSWVALIIFGEYGYRKKR